VAFVPFVVQAFLFMTLEQLRAGGKAAVAAALAQLERAPDADETLALLDAAYAAPQAHVIGLTGPPGVGKSTLLGALIRHWRAAGRSVAVIAVDPSSRRSGGALLGDRTRLRTDPEDAGTFVRSMAARDRLGGLAALTLSAMVVMRALYDLVVIETVGVGQSETEIAGAADTVVLCVQPGSGDSLQFMKAGIIEIPHVMVVTKADTGEAAERAAADLGAALALAETDAGAWQPPVLRVAALRETGIGELAAALAGHWDWLGRDGRLGRARQAQAESWLAETIRERFGREGLRRAGPLTLAEGVSPFRASLEIARGLSL
jgi:LAO/AO transport system kinase